MSLLAAVVVILFSGSADPAFDPNPWIEDLNQVREADFWPVAGGTRVWPL